MRAAYVPPVRCVYAKEQACIGYWDALHRLVSLPNVDLVMTLFAHGLLESGNFSRGLWNNNPGNIKAGEDYEGEFTCITLNEVLMRDGRHVEVWFSPAGELEGGLGTRVMAPDHLVPPGHPQTRMRAYPTLADGIADKVRFLSRPIWAVALDRARAGDVSGYVRAIRSRGYFTAYAGQPDPTPYETSMVALAKAHRQMVAECQGQSAYSTPIRTEPVGALEATKFDQDVLGAELRARTAAANEPITDAILAEARKRDT